MKKKKDNRIFLPVDRLPLISYCGYLSTDTGFVHPDRVMDVNVLLYAEEGGFHIIEEEAELTVEAGDLVFLKQGLHHYGDIMCPKGTKWFFVHFHLPEDKNETEKASFEPYIYGEGSSGKESCPCLVLPKKLHMGEKSSIFNKFMTLLKMCESGEYEGNIKMNAYLYDILSDIYLESISKKHGDSARIAKLTEYLDAHADTAFSSDEIEKVMGLSFKHLNVIFKAATGTTLGRYHYKVRMEKARRLLLETSLPISEISDLLGFESAYYFSNCYKKHYGLSPAGYRKNNIFI